MIKNRFLQDKFNSCHRSRKTTALPMNTEKENTTAENKIVVYQVLPVYSEIKIPIISLDN
jgi:hypothetical protein